MDAVAVGQRVKRLLKYLRISQTIVAKEVFGNRTRQYVADRVNGKKPFVLLELKALAILFCLPEWSIEYLLDEDKYKTLHVPEL